MKFGGSAVGTTTALTQVVSIVLQEHERWDQVLLVASALEGVTDALLEAAHLAKLDNRRGYRRIVATIRTRHLALVDQLPLNANERSALHADIDRLLFDMLDTCQTLAQPTMEEANTLETIDSVISTGERIAARIIAALIRSNGLRGVAIDTTEIIITDDNFSDAKPDMDETCQRLHDYLSPMLERGIIPVLTGFIGATPKGKTTTMGRGGSDYTAAIVGVCTGSQEVWMWADVDGMMSTDPREIIEAKVIPQLSYDEIAELAYFGARIVHPRMIGLVRQRQIPVRIKNVYKPQQTGTMVCAEAKSEQMVKAVTSIRGIGFMANSSGPLSEIQAFIHETMKRVLGSAADVTIYAQSSTRTFLCVVIPTPAGPNAADTMFQAFEQTLEETSSLQHWSITPVSIITVIGDTSGQHSLGHIFTALNDLRILAISQGPGYCSLSVVVTLEDSREALQYLHDLTR